MKKKVLFVFSILFGIMFISSGLNKFLNFMPLPEDIPVNLKNTMAAFSGIGWLLPLVGIVEVIAGILFIIPKFRAFAAIMILPIMIGILLTHAINAPSGLPVALILMLINLWVIIEERKKYLPMINN